MKVHSTFDLEKIKRNLESTVTNKMIAIMEEIIEEATSDFLCPEHQQKPTVSFTGDMNAMDFKIKGCCDSYNEALQSRLNAVIKQRKMDLQQDEQ